MLQLLKPAIPVPLYEFGKGLPVPPGKHVAENPPLGTCSQSTADEQEPPSFVPLPVPDTVQPVGGVVVLLVTLNPSLRRTVCAFMPGLAKKSEASRYIFFIRLISIGYRILTGNALKLPLKCKHNIKFRI
jgi:hypothetical protein